jgi:hypothetical protein
MLMPMLLHKMLGLIWLIIMIAMLLMLGQVGSGNIWI